MKLQNAAAPLILRKKKRESVKEALKDLHWLNIDQRLSYKILLLVFKCLHNLAPSSLIKTLSVKTTNTLILQTKYFPKTNLGRRAFSFYAPRQWNCLPESLRCTEDIESYKSQLKTYLFSDFTNFCQRYNKYDNLLKLWALWLFLVCEPSLSLVIAGLVVTGSFSGWSRFTCLWRDAGFGLSPVGLQLLGWAFRRRATPF